MQSFAPVNFYHLNNGFIGCIIIKAICNTIAHSQFLRVPLHFA